VARLLLLPRRSRAKVELSVSSGTVKTTTHTRIHAAAAADAGRRADQRHAQPAQSQPVGAATGRKARDVFEREIESVSRSFDGGKDAAAARTALFLKGKVLGRPC